MADLEKHAAAKDVAAPAVDDERVLHADFFDAASGPAVRAQRMRLLALLGTVALCLVWLRPALPALPAELRPGSLRGCGGRRPHLHRPLDLAAADGYAGALAGHAALSGDMSQAVAATGADPDKVQRFLEALFLTQPSAASVRESLRRYTGRTHVAGTDADRESALALMMEWGTLLDADLPAADKREELLFDAGTPEAIHYMTASARNFTASPHARAGATREKPHPLGEPRVWTDTYSSWLNYPVSASLTLSKPDADSPYWTASLKEDVLPGAAEGMPVFHGYSKTGKASGPVVYAALCSKKDFERLAALGVEVKGAVTLCRYGGPFRGLKVRASADAGAVGTLIYSDPAEDGEVTEANGYAAYPDGPARNPSSVQRGSVQALSIAPGDASTIGYPSYRNATRPAPEDCDSLPAIPSLPISYTDAKALLVALQGHGTRAKDVGENWEGKVPGVDEYWTGPSEHVAALDNQMTDIAETHDIWNAYALIPGFLEDELVVIGNHRDAWTFGGADPSSGTATTSEVVKALGALTKIGWRPLRTILIASWDAEEYGLIASTEFVEDYPKFLERAVAYLNIDVAVAGSQIDAQASPSLAGLILDAAAEIADPETNGTANLKLEYPGPLGSGSDFTGFLQHLGIASTNVGYGRKKTDPVYHYHSNYDTFAWMEQFGDPTFERHLAVSKLLGLTALRTASALTVPIDTAAYAKQLSVYLDKVDKLVEEAKLPHVEDARLRKDLHKLAGAIKKVQHNAHRLEKRKVHLVKEVKALLSGHKKGYAELLAQQAPLKKHKHGKPDDAERLRGLLLAIRDANAASKAFERGFISKHGLPLRPWYRHLGVAPGRWLGYGATTFPALTEAITLDGGKGAGEAAQELAEKLEHLADAIKPHGHPHFAHAH